MFQLFLAQKLCNDAKPLIKSMVNQIIDGPILTGEALYHRLGKHVLKNKGYFLEHPLNKNIIWLSVAGYFHSIDFLEHLHVEHFDEVMCS